MSRKKLPPPDRSEQMDQGTLDHVDDGELCTYQVVDGELVETVIRPPQRRSGAKRRR